MYLLVCLRVGEGNIQTYGYISDYGWDERKEDYLTKGGLIQSLDIKSIKG